MCELSDVEIKRVQNKEYKFPKKPEHMNFNELSNWYCRLLHHLFPNYRATAQNKLASFCDIAQCIAVLGDRTLFEELFRDWDKQYYSPCYDAFGAGGDAAATAKTAPAHSNKMSSILLHFLVRECGFLKVPGITFFGGEGNAFIPTVQNGMIFKDGLSNVHGEYSHNIQWCIIGWAHEKNKINLRSVDKVVSVYRSLVSGRFMSGKILDREFPPKKEVAIWDVVCDTINPKQGSQYEIAGENIYSRSYRSPAYLTQKMLCNSSIKECRVSEILCERYTHQDRKWFDKDKQEISASPNKHGVNEVTLERIRQRYGNGEKAIDEAGKVAYFPDFFEKLHKKRDNVMSPKSRDLPSVPNEDLWESWDAILARATEPGDFDGSSGSSAAEAATTSMTGGAAGADKK